MKVNFFAILTMFFFVLGIIIFTLGLVFDYNIYLLLMGTICIAFADTNYNNYKMNKLEDRINVLEKIYG
jgi:hypothetical protein